MKAGSFAALASALALVVVPAASAQPPAQTPPRTLPPAPAALSIPNPFAGLHPGTRDLYRSPDGSDRFQHASLYPAPPIVLIPAIPSSYGPVAYYTPGLYGLSCAATPAHGRAARQPAPIATGGLTLETWPDVAQVHVDGLYEGIVQNFGVRGRPLDLSPGEHRVELRAQGHTTLGFSVTIAPGQIVRFRGDLAALPTDARGPTPGPSAPQKDFYVIPNCYAGDKPPNGPLPPGCDLAKLQTRR